MCLLVSHYFFSIITENWSSNTAPVQGNKKKKAKVVASKGKKSGENANSNALPNPNATTSPTVISTSWYHSSTCPRV